jgi:hypothetical protein
MGGVCTGGNADVYQNKVVTGKAICKTMKIKGYQIDLIGRAIHKFMKTKERQTDGASWPVGAERRLRIGVDIRDLGWCETEC